MTSTSRLSALAECTRVAASFPRHEPPYEFEIGVADSYDALFGGERSTKTSSPAGVLDLAAEWGRLLISAEAGAGKTSFLQRLFRTAVEQEEPTFLIDLRLVTPALGDLWKESSGGRTWSAWSFSLVSSQNQRSTKGPCAVFWTVRGRSFSLMASMKHRPALRAACCRYSTTSPRVTRHAP